MFKRFNKQDTPNGAATAAPSLVSSAKLAPTAATAPAPVNQKPEKKAKSKKVKPSPPKAVALDPKEAKRAERLLEIRMNLHKRLLESLNLAALDKASEEDLKHEIASIAREGLRDMDVVLNTTDQKQLNSDLLDEVTGLGPIEVLLRDDTVNDILINGSQQIFVERAGILELTTVKFKDEKHLMRIIDKIVSAVGRRVDESSPYVDARLADGSRFNAMVPPCAVDGSLVSIRKFTKDKLSIDQLIKFGAFNEAMATYLQAAVATRLNIIVSGGTGSGKTTTLNALSGFIGDE